MSDDMKNPIKYGDDMKNHPNYGDDTITISLGNKPLVLNRINHGDKVRFMDTPEASVYDYGNLVLSLDPGPARDKFTYDGTFGNWTLELNDGSLHRDSGQIFLMPDHYQY